MLLCSTPVVGAMLQFWFMTAVEIMNTSFVIQCSLHIMLDSHLNAKLSNLPNTKLANWRRTCQMRIWRVCRLPKRAFHELVDLWNAKLWSTYFRTLHVGSRWTRDMRIWWNDRLTKYAFWWVDWLTKCAFGKSNDSWPTLYLRSSTILHCNENLEYDCSLWVKLSKRQPQNVLQPLYVTGTIQTSSFVIFPSNSHVRL